VADVRRGLAGDLVVFGVLPADSYHVLDLCRVALASAGS